MTVLDLCRGVAKLVKALDFDSSIRRFDSFHPCQIDGPLPRTLIQSSGIGLLCLVSSFDGIKNRMDIEYPVFLVRLLPLHCFNAKHRWTPHASAQP